MQILYSTYEQFTLLESLRILNFEFNISFRKMAKMQLFERSTRDHILRFKASKFICNSPSLMTRFSLNTISKGHCDCVFSQAPI